MISFQRRLWYGFITSFLVGFAIVIHSEWGYFVPPPERYSEESEIEMCVMFCGWPVRHQFQVVTKEGSLLLRAVGDSARDRRDIPNGFPWGLVSHTGIDEFRWNICIWLAFTACTFTYTLFPLVSGWQFRNFSIAHFIFLATFIAAFLRVSYGELSAWTHLPIAYGVTCSVIEFVRFPSRLLFCYRCFFQRVRRYNQ